MKKNLKTLVSLLLVFGLIIIYSSTSYSSQELFGNAFRFVYLQLGWVFLGYLAFIFFSNFEYKKLKGFAYWVFFINLGLLIVLAFVGLFVCKEINSTGFGIVPCINGASRWFNFNLPYIGIVGLQPGELAKLSIILYLSFQFYKKNDEVSPFIIYLVTSLLVAFLLLLQPNMSTAGLVFVLGTVVYFVSGESLKLLVASLPMLLLVVVLVIVFSPYRRSRLTTLFGDKDDELTSGYHSRQIMIALGSGGLAGVGFGQSRQKFHYLPEVATDSIFAIIGEEFGFLGTFVVLCAFGYLIYIGLLIAKRAPDKLGKLLASGITSWISLQLFVNVAAMTKLIPLTGVPIPLISYGGSSMVFSLIGLGILSNIAGGAKK